MWGRKETRSCYDADGVVTTEEYIEVENDWKEVFVEGAFGLYTAFILGFVCLFFTPFMMVRAAYMRWKHPNVPVPPEEVRERAHLF